LLLQKDELVEAEKWLRQALQVQYSLPDGGRNARMQLREIQRRREGLDKFVPGVVQADPVVLSSESCDVQG
jgi:hypothetical protein